MQYLYSTVDSISDLRTHFWKLEGAPDSAGTSHEDQSTPSIRPMFSFFPSHLFSSPFLLLLPRTYLLVVTQTRGYMVGSSTPSPPRHVPCIFIATRLQHFVPSSASVERVWYYNTFFWASMNNNGDSLSEYLRLVGRRTLRHVPRGTRVRPVLVATAVP